MHSRITLILLSILFFTSIGYAQSCDSLLKSSIRSELKQAPKILKKLTNCSNFDLFDLEWCAPYWSQLYEENKKKESSYSTFITQYGDFKKTETYIDYRKKYYPTFQFNNKLASIKNWEEDKKFLISTGVSEDILEKYKNYILTNQNKNLTHKQLLQKFKGQKNN